MLTRAVPGAELAAGFLGLPVSRLRASTPAGVNQVEVQKPRIPSPKMEAKIGIPALHHARAVGAHRLLQYALQC